MDPQDVDDERRREWVSSLYWENKGTIDETEAAKAKDKDETKETEETEAKETEESNKRILQSSGTLNNVSKEQYSTRDDADKFSHFVQGNTPNIVQQPPSCHSLTKETRESDRRILQKSATFEEDRHMVRDDVDNFSRVQVRCSTPTIVQRPFSHTGYDDEKVPITAPAPYSNRVQPMMDFRPPTRDYIRPPTRDYIRPPTREGGLDDLRSLRSSRVAPSVGKPSQANDHFHFSGVLMFTCFLCFIPSGGLTLIGALCLLPALICAAVGADYNKEGRSKEARNLGLAALICSAVTIILTAILVVLGVIGGIIALQLLVLANN